MSTTRNQKRVIKRQLEKAYKKRIIVPTHVAFDKIESELIDFGWSLVKKRDYYLGLNGKLFNTTIQELHLRSKLFHITLMPHKEGIEISRLEVSENFRNRGYAGNFLKCILMFLLKNEIDDVFLFPSPIVTSEFLGSPVMDTPNLERFYSKRGFRKLPNSNFWKLDKSTFLSYIQEETVDFELLKINYIPIGSDVFIGRSFNGKYQSMPIKMRIYNRA